MINLKVETLMGNSNTLFFQREPVGGANRRKARVNPLLSCMAT